MSTPVPAELLSSDEPVRIVQIVPPGTGGVRDHALGLQLEWAQRGIATVLLPLARTDAGSDSLTERLSGFGATGADAPPAVLLHLSGYGYAPRGLCFWLVRELAAARRTLGPRCRVVTMVHELFASGPPWQSAFWLGGLQARVVRAVVRQSDVVVTNSDHHAAWLRPRVRAGVPVRVAPVFSNVGEPADIRLASARGHGLVVFGSASTRQRAFDRVGAHLGELKALRVSRIVEAGPGTASRFDAGAFARMHAGERTPAEIEALLQEHRYGLIDYPSFHLGKSGVFAAYAANGCIVLDTAADRVEADGLRSGEHYLTLAPAAAATLRKGAANAMAARLHAWYLPHRRGRQATEFLNDLLR